MATAATIDVLLRANTAQYRAAMIDAGRVANQNLGAIRKESAATAQSIQTLNRAAAGFLGFQALSNGIGALIEARKSIEAIKFGLVSATGSAAGAEKAYGFVAQTAKELGLNLQSAAKDFTRLSASAAAAGVSMSDQQKLYVQLARSATALRLTELDVTRATNALSQSFSKGKFQAEELRQQLSEAVPGAFARFQKNVLEMTKGTEIADKSFDDLLKGGLLDVQKFLPAMVKALEETGRGAEEASKGLAAELNRLSTAWFNLKAETSDGVFSDVAITSVRLMHENLAAIAGLATVAGGVLASRVIGAGIGRAGQVASATVIQPARNRLGDAISASMMVDVAKARAAEASEAVKQAKAAQDLNSAWVKQSGVAADVARDQLAVAYASKEAAERTILYQQSNMQLWSSLSARRGMEAQAEKATRALARAQANYDAAVASGNIAKGRELQLRARVIALQEAEVLATNNLTAAKARETEASSAAGLGATISRGASAAGSAALELVGGPMGAAVLAIGAMGFAYLDMKRKAEEATAEFNKQKDSLNLLNVTLADTVDRAKKGSTSVSEMAQAWNQAGVELRGAEDRVKALEAQIANYQARIEQARTSTREGSGLTIGADYEGLQRAQDELAKFQAQIAPTRQKFIELEGSLKQALDPKTFEALRAAALKADDVQFEKLLAGLTDVQRQAFGAADAINKITTAAGGAVWQQQIEYIRKTRGEYQAWLTEQGKAINEAGGLQAMTAEQRRAFNAQAAAMRHFIELNRQFDESNRRTSGSTKSATKAASERENQLNSLLDRINRQIALDKEAMLVNDKMTAAERLRAVVREELRSTTSKLSEVEKNRVRALLDDAVAQGKAKVEMEEARKAAESMLQLQQQLNEAYKSRALQNNADLAGLVLGSDAIERMQRMVDLQQEYQRQVEALNDRFKDREVSAAQAAAYQSELDALGKHYDDMLLLEQDYQTRRAEYIANGWNGAYQAMQQYITDAGDIAGQTQELFTNAITGLEGVISDFISKGKADWRGFLDSIAAEFVRMAVRQQLSTLLQRFLPGVEKNSDAAALSSAAGQLAASAGPLLAAAAALSASAAALAAASAMSSAGSIFSGGSNGLANSIVGFMSAGGGGIGAFGFADGGFTGVGGRLQPAGLVHKGEGVLSAPEVASIGGESGFNALRKAIKSGYADGGFVSGSSRVVLGPRVPGGGMDGGGRALKVEQHFHNPRMYDRRSDSQRAAESAQKLKQGVRFA